MSKTGSQSEKTARVESDLFRPPMYDEEDDDNDSNCSSESGCLEFWQKAFGKKEFGRGTFDNDSRTQNLVKDIGSVAGSLLHVEEEAVSETQGIDEVTE